MMEINQITGAIVDIAYRIHKTLGPGLFESIYEEIMYLELIKQGFKVERQKEICVFWDGHIIPKFGFRADLIVNDCVIIELKSISALAPVHFKQVQTYLKLTNIKVGLLINFNEPLIKNGIKRIVNNL